MTAIIATILPQSYFDGLSSLWGGCAYIGSAIVAGSLAFTVVNTRPDAWSFIRLLLKVFMIALATLFLREWLMRLNDIVYAFGTFMGVQPDNVDDQFVEFLRGKSQNGGNTSVWDVIWGTKSLGTALSYALLWLFGWMSWGVQYIVKLIGGILLTSGWALSPIFLAFFMLRPMAAVARKYIIGLIALVCWPFGWVIAAVVTQALLQTAATASLIPIPISTGVIGAPMLTVLLVGIWMLISSILAPWVTMKVFLMGANPAAAFAQGVGGAGQAALAGGTGAAVVAATGGAGAPLVIASAAAAALSSGTESAMRGGGSARTTETVIGGFAGMNTGRFMRQNAESAQSSASARMQRAAAAESMANTYAENFRQQRRSRSGFDAQPHDDDPNKSARDLDNNDSDNNNKR